MKYLIGLKSSITHVFSHNYVIIKVYLYDSLPLEKTLVFQNAIMHIKSISTKDEHQYYWNLFLEKCSDHLSRDNDNEKVFFKFQMLHYDRIDVSKGIDIN